MRDLNPLLLHHARRTYFINFGSTLNILLTISKFYPFSTDATEPILTRYQNELTAQPNCEILKAEKFNSSGLLWLKFSIMCMMKTNS